ncbi:hypothetical protein ALC53_02407, partial [Atta colombica]
ISVYFLPRVNHLTLARVNKIIRRTLTFTRARSYLIHLIANCAQSYHVSQYARTRAQTRDYNGPTLINVIGVHPCVINSVLLTLKNSLTYIKLEMDVHTHLNKLKRKKSNLVLDLIHYGLIHYGQQALLCPILYLPNSNILTSRLIHSVIFFSIVTRGNVYQGNVIISECSTSLSSSPGLSSFTLYRSSCVLIYGMRDANPPKRALSETVSPRMATENAKSPRNAIGHD